ncbi:protein FAR-RED IMPAIRED RESPONSE 1-like [Argentina anserina]|uniref:protein FAR-RED IMPAIRED RESPONSE 1-like n=1 Tax=Argentina anserina TaxID=57926 RepID=UPI0021763B1E|nr:protein FAR-RED IMPAIRED RESPONSE 1-like [Potentilla anserina]
MQNAVSTFISEARHRLCAWHIGKNVKQHLKDVDTQNDFFHLTFAGLTISEWESQWNYFVTMNQLENNSWVNSMYDRRQRWAEAFFRDQFFGGVCSTQRCERMHRNLRGGIGRYMRLFEVLPCMEKNKDRIRNRCLHDDYRSEQFQPVYGTHLRTLEEEIGKKFTHDVFLLIRDQIMYERSFVVRDDGVDNETGVSSFMISHCEKRERQWIVSCNNNENSLVKKRWIKEATAERTLLSSGLSSVVQLARYGDLMSDCAKFCHLASFSAEGYEKTKEVISQLVIRGQKYRVANQNTSQFDSHKGLHPNVVKDPIVFKSKSNKSKTCGVKKKKGCRCGACKKRGHDRRTCGREMAREKKEVVTKLRAAQRPKVLLKNPIQIAVMLMLPPVRWTKVMLPVMMTMKTT